MNGQDGKICDTGSCDQIVCSNLLLLILLLLLFLFFFGGGGYLLLNTDNAIGIKVCGMAAANSSTCMNVVQC